MKNGVMTPSTNTKIMANLHDLNQMAMFLPKDESLKPYQSPIRKQVQQVQKNNVKYVVNNPAAGLVSPTYARMGAQLDQIMNDARVKYISGQINKSGLKAAINHWRQAGGDQVIKEINQLYQKEQSGK